MLELLGHRVERLRKFSDFRPAHQMDALREITLGYSPAGLGQHGKRIRYTPRREDADSNAQQHGEQREQASRTLHLVYTAVGVSSRLLHHHRPVQRLDWAVGAKHFDLFRTRAHVEFPRLGELSFVTTKQTCGQSPGFSCPGR